jgi:RNA polymerase sigma-B factor
MPLGRGLVDHPHSPVGEPASNPSSEPDPWIRADERFHQMADAGPGERRGLRDAIICECTPAARREAQRYRHTGESMEDLSQVAVVGLILSVNRFDPGRGIPFRHFALPTIRGELKRHFRDKGWSVKVSRRVQELYLQVNQAEPLLAQRLGRMPTTKDLARYLKLPERDVVAARNGEAAYSARSLDWPLHGDDHGADLGTTLGELDRSMEAVADRDALRRAAVVLTPRLASILELRFVDELSQAQIADKLGISQMHVSRLLHRSLDMLRRHMTTERPTTLAA